MTRWTARDTRAAHHAAGDEATARTIARSIEHIHGLAPGTLTWRIDRPCRHWRCRAARVRHTVRAWWRAYRAAFAIGCAIGALITLAVAR